MAAGRALGGAAVRETRDATGAVGDPVTPWEPLTRSYLSLTPTPVTRYTSDMSQSGE